MITLGKRVRRQLPVIPTFALLFIGYLILSNDFTFAELTAEEEKARFSEDVGKLFVEVITKFKISQSITENQTLIDCYKTVATMVGELPEQEDEVDLSGIYSRFVHGYHYAFPAITWWPEAHEEFHKSRQVFLHAREAQKVWEHLELCKQPLSEVYQYIYFELIPKLLDDDYYPTTEDQNMYYKIEKEIQDICLLDEDFPPWVIEKLPEEVLTSCFETMALVINSFWGAGHKKKVAETFDPPFDTSLFGRMHLDTVDADMEIHKRITDTFPKYIDKVRSVNPREADFLQTKLDEIRAKLKTPPFDKIYLNGDEDALEERRENFDFNGWSDFTDAIFDLVQQYNSIDRSNTLEDNIDYWREDLHNFIEDLDNKKFGKYVKVVEQFYEEWIKVDPIDVNNPNISSETSVLMEYGETWDWDLELPIQNMRAAWNLVVAVLEEIKCYMKDTYFYDLREEALRRTQRDLNNGSLYYGISYTIFLPCRITDELDLVSPHCLAANNEICAPMGPLDDLQRPGRPLHGGFSMLRPKWVYKYDPNQRKCVGRKDYVAQIYHCRCGFRMDCGNDIGENITCQLQYNDLVRGQCRGGVGYPCKTLPLAPGKHDETCKSGYCNMNKNSCEDAPYHPVFVAQANTLRLSFKLCQATVLLMGIMEFWRFFIE